MNDNELDLIRLAANDNLLFHKGSWGGPAGYRWRGPDGVEAGIVPPTDAETLDSLTNRGMIAIEPRLGPLDRRVTATRAGLNALHGQQQYAA